MRAALFGVGDIQVGSSTSGTSSSAGYGVLESFGEAEQHFASTITNFFIASTSKWKRETFLVSSPTRVAKHPSYQAIIRLGKVALPLILADLQKQQDHWYIALREISGHDPVLASDRGDMGKMTKAWLRWGKEHGYLSE